MGLAPTRTRVTASRLDDFGLDHGPPGRDRTSVARLSAECSAVELRVGRRGGAPSPCGKDGRTCTGDLVVPDHAFCCLNYILETWPRGRGRRALVRVAGIAPTASRSPTVRSNY